jgi:hypothetical protein
MAGPYWTKEARRGLPEPWPESGERKLTWNGDELELRRRLVAFDPLDQAATRQIRAILWRDGRILHTEEHTLLERLYFRNEVLQMLSIAGFRGIQEYSEFTDAPPSQDSEILVYAATS